MFSYHTFLNTRNNNNLFRAHCNNRGQGPWYDWVMIRWESNSKRRQAKVNYKNVMLDILKLIKQQIQTFYILLVKSYVLSLQNQALNMPLSNAVILIFKEDQYFQLYGNKNIYLHQEVIKDLSYAT